MTRPAAMMRFRDTHPCPGGCRRQVAHHLFSCPGCWRRLPFPLRQRISATWRRDFREHAEAMTEARQWYRTHTTADGGAT